MQVADLGRHKPGSSGKGIDVVPPAVMTEAVEQGADIHGVKAVFKHSNGENSGHQQNLPGVQWNSQRGLWRAFAWRTGRVRSRGIMLPYQSQDTNHRIVQDIKISGTSSRMSFLYCAAIHVKIA